MFTALLDRFGMLGGVELELPDRDAEENEVAGHVGCKNSAKAEVTDGIGTAGGRRQRQEERVTNSRSQAAAGLLRFAVARRCAGTALARRSTSEA